MDPLALGALLAWIGRAGACCGGAGRGRAASLVVGVVEAVEDGFVYFRQVSAREAAQHGPLVVPPPRSA